MRTAWSGCISKTKLKCFITTAFRMKFEQLPVYVASVVWLKDKNVLLRKSSGALLQLTFP